MPKFDHSFSSLINFTPALLMSGLALLSFVLVKHSPQATNNAQLQQIANTDHDYYLQSFIATRFGNSGNVDSHIRGMQAEHFERAKELVITNMSFHFNRAPNLYRGSANKGVINDAANSMHLYGQVSVQRNSTEDKAKNALFQSQFLKLTTQPDTLSSDKTVKISDERSVIIANSLQYDATAKTLKMNGAVNIKINSNQ